MLQATNKQTAANRTSQTILLYKVNRTRTYQKQTLKSSTIQPKNVKRPSNRLLKQKSNKSACVSLHAKDWQIMRSNTASLYS